MFILRRKNNVSAIWCLLLLDVFVFILLHFLSYSSQITRIFRYFPVREIYIQTSGFHLHPHHHQPKIENPGTTRVYCSVYIFTVNLQARTTYPPYLTTICRNDYYFHFFSGEPKWSEVKHVSWKWVVCVIFII